MNRLAPYRYFIGFFLILIAVRIVAPYVIKYKINEYLKTASPNYSGHIEDFRMSLLRGAYGLEGVELSLKQKPIVFLEADDIDVAISWKELFLGHVRMNITVKGSRFYYSQYVLQQLSKNTQENLDSARDIKNTLFPVSVEEIRIRNGQVTSSDFFGVTDKLPTQLESIEATITNLTPSEEKQISHFKVSGDFPKKSPLHIQGLFNSFQTPMGWKAKLKVQSFDLVSTNQWMYAMVPITFESGAVSIFAEVESRNQHIVGYAKPFIKHAHIIGDDKDFKGFKQFGLELSASVVNHLFRTSKDKTVATIFKFKYADNKLDWDLWDVLKELFKNGYVETLTEDFESGNSTTKAE